MKGVMGVVWLLFVSWCDTQGCVSLIKGVEDLFASCIF